MDTLKELIDLVSNEKEVTINERELYSIPEFLDFGGANMRPLFKMSLFESFCLNYGYRYRIPNNSRFISIKLP